MVEEKNVKRGKKSKAQGALFEIRVRNDLEEKGWVVDKWTNNVEFGHTANSDGSFTAVKWKDLTLQNGEHYPGPVARLIRAKNKWSGPGRPISQGAGFPDFIAFRKIDIGFNYEVIGVESKTNGDLSREEKEKCRWLLDHGIFSKILIAEKTKVKNLVVIVYHDFKEKFFRFYK